MVPICWDNDDEREGDTSTDQNMMCLDSPQTRRGREHRSSERQHTPSPDTSGTAAETCRDHEADLETKTLTSMNIRKALPQITQTVGVIMPQTSGWGIHRVNKL